MLRMSRKTVSSIEGASKQKNESIRDPPQRNQFPRPSTSTTTPHFQLFVYDTGLLLRECDDPASAVIFAHPAAIPVERKLAIAGTLAGLFNFFEQLTGDEVGALFFFAELLLCPGLLELLSPLRHDLYLYRVAIQVGNNHQPACTNSLFR